MRRALLLLLTLCALISVGRFAVSAAAACAHADAAGSGTERECCRARTGRAHEHGDAATQDPAPAAAATHCAGEKAHAQVSHAPSRAILAPAGRNSVTAFSLVAFGGTGGCDDCCARSRTSLPSPVAAPAQKSADATVIRPVSSQRLVAPDAPHQPPHDTPQHAPPGATPLRLLISVFQI